MNRNFGLEAVLADLVTDPKLLRCEHEVLSTMILAREMLSGDPVPPFWGLALAEQQSEGRGRVSGRSWFSVTGNLHVTFLCSLANKELSELSGLSLAVGCALAEVLRELGLDTCLKWPNDILAPDGRKLGGLLIELCQHRDSWVALIGLGLNLRVAPAEGACIQELVSAQSSPALNNPESFLQRFVPRLKSDLKKFELCGFKGFRETWLRYNCGKERILVTLGDEKVEAFFLGVTEKGSLVVNYQGRVCEIFSGEILTNFAAPKA